MNRRELIERLLSMPLLSWLRPQKSGGLELQEWSGTYPDKTYPHTGKISGPDYGTRQVWDLNLLAAEGEHPEEWVLWHADGETTVRIGPSSDVDIDLVDHVTGKCYRIVRR